MKNQRDDTNLREREMERLCEDCAKRIERMPVRDEDGLEES